MSWQETSVKLVAPFEGCEKRLRGMIVPYLDKLAKPPLWTRGYGRTYGITEASPAITPAQALLELQEGVEAYGMKCVALAPALLAKPECLAAITSWSWNCGIGAF